MLNNMIEFLYYLKKGKKIIFTESEFKLTTFVSKIQIFNVLRLILTLTIISLFLNRLKVDLNHHNILRNVIFLQ